MELLLPRATAETVLDDAGFDRLFREHYPSLVRLVTRVTGEPAAAEELASDAFVQLLHARRPPPEPVAWLRRVAINAAIDRLRSSRRRRAREIATHHISAAPAEADPERERQRSQVREVLARLRTRDAQLLICRMSGCTHREIALSLGVEESSAGTLLARAEKSFEKEYVKSYGKA